MSVEQTRLTEDREGKIRWKMWESCLSERRWGTVREDYTPNGDARNFFTHNHALSCAYRRPRRSAIYEITT